MQRKEYAVRYEDLLSRRPLLLLQALPKPDLSPTCRTPRFGGVPLRGLVILQAAREELPNLDLRFFVYLQWGLDIACTSWPCKRRMS